MANQIACFLTTWDGDGTQGNAYRPTFSDNLQSGEHWANNLVDLISVISQYEDDLPSADVVEKHDVVRQAITNGIGFVYVYADDARITSANANSNYLVWWTYTINRNAVIASSDKLPTQQPNLSELTALQAYLTSNTGRTASQIATFLRNQFNVADNLELQTFILNNPRKATVNRLAPAFATQAQAG